LIRLLMIIQPIMDSEVFGYSRYDKISNTRGFSLRNLASSALIARDTARWSKSSPRVTKLSMNITTLLPLIVTA
jgi:hypothetical protein